MKKCAAFLLALVCAAGLFGCAGRQPEYPEYVEPDFTRQPATVTASYSDVEGISVQADGVYVHPDKTTLVVSWNNRTDYPVTYGESFEIERLENGEWVDCALGENVFHMIGYLLPANKSVNKEYTLTDMYDISTPGTYRFLSTCSVEMEGEYPKTCALWSEFTVE